MNGARVNVIGTVSVMEIARKHSIKRLAYASSVAVHGIWENSEWLATLYGAYKLCNENTAKVYWRDWQVPSVGIRPNVVYGPARDQGMSSLPTVAMLAATLEQPFEIPFTGTVGFLYAREAAAAFVQAVAEPREGAPVFDLNGAPATVQRVVDLIKQYRPGARVSCTGDPLPFPGDVDDDALAEHIGAYRRWTLEEGLQETMITFRRLVDAGQLSAADVKI